MLYVLCVAVALASLGLGGTRLTTATMGADQFDKPNNQVTFFSWYFLTLYVAITICQLHRHRLYSGQCQLGFGIWHLCPCKCYWLSCVFFWENSFIGMSSRREVLSRALHVQLLLQFGEEGQWKLFKASRIIIMEVEILLKQLAVQLKVSGTLTPLLI